MSHPEQPPVDEASDDEPKGQLDLAAVLYVVGGIPVMILFLVGLFALVGACDQMNVMIPA